MKHSKFYILIAVLCLCAVFVTGALAESALNTLWDSGCDFLFHTDNVTVTGKASFSLDGEHFKTAELRYIQDGYSSFYGLKLLTPREDGSERETGWTIIADEEGSFAVMEVYEPGVYRRGTDTPQNSLLRRSVRLDALTELGGPLLKQVELLLPEDAVTVADTNGERTVHIVISEDQIPQVALSALNLAAGYLSDRWFAYGYDRTVIKEEAFTFDHYVTPTEALTDGTVRWTLRSLDADFSLDSQNRLTAVRGTAKVASTFWDGTVREVEVQFDFSINDYGTSSVKPFDPADYNVELAYVWDEEGQEEAVLDQPEPEMEDEPAISSVPAQPTENLSPKTITAVASEIDPEHLASVIINVRITDYSSDENALTVELLVPETYDREEVLSLTVGDAIYTQGQEIVIRTLSEAYGYLVINEGEFEFSDDSVWLYEQEDGNFAIDDWGDNSWMTLAELKVPVKDTLLFLDGINPSSGESLSIPTVHNAADFLAMLKMEKEEGGPGFAVNNAIAVFDDAGQLAMIQRYYVPWQ